MTYSFDVIKYYPNHFLLRLGLSFFILGLMVLLLVSMSSLKSLGLVFTLSSLVCYVVFIRYVIERTKKIGELKIDNENVIYGNKIIAIKDIKNIIVTGESFVAVHYSKHRAYRLKVNNINNEIFFIKLKTYGINNEGKQINLFDILNKKNLTFSLKIR